MPALRCCPPLPQAVRAASRQMARARQMSRERAMLVTALALASCSSGSAALRGGGKTLAGQVHSLLARAASGQAPTWSMFGGDDHHTHRSTHTGPATNKLKWKCSIDTDVYYSSP